MGSIVIIMLFGGGNLDIRASSFWFWILGRWKTSESFRFYLEQSVLSQFLQHVLDVLDLPIRTRNVGHSPVDCRKPLFGDITPFHPDEFFV